MDIRAYLTVAFIVSLFICAQCEFFTFGAFTAVSGLGYYAYQKYYRCNYEECCTPDYIQFDAAKLNNLLYNQLFGQHIAHQTIYNALRAHSIANTRKPLVMSFHGPSGTGKTHVANMIANAFYKKGTQSKYYHFFNGRSDFPSDHEVGKYQEELRRGITDSLKSCGKSLFVFDEVDKMPEGVLNALVPFMDYSDWHRSFRYTGEEDIQKNDAIYIFLSNTGASQIVQELLQVWRSGKQREKTSLQDFEKLISIGAFNEKGGLRHSDTITTSVIDHYVPFLPLEEKHVKQCLVEAFKQRNISEPSILMMEEAMSHVTFGPPPHDLYSNGGCKRLEQKVAAIVYKFKTQAVRDV